MIDPAAQADYDAMKVALAAAEAAGARLFARAPELPDPPPEPIFDVPAHISLIEEAGQTFVSVDIANDVDAPRDYEFFAEPIYDTATADDIDIAPGPHVLKQGSRLVLIPVTPRDDQIPDSGETLRIRITCAQAVTLLNDTCLVTITDSDVTEPQPDVTFHKWPINAADHIFSADWDKGFERYERGIRRRILEAGKSETLTFYRKNRATGGTGLPFPGFEYALLFGDVEVARARPAGKYALTFDIVVDQLPAAITDAPYQSGLKQYDEQGNEVAISPYAFVRTFVYVNRHGKLNEAPWFPAYNSSYRVAHNGSVFRCAIIPRRYFFNDDGTWRLPNPAPLSPQESDIVANPRGVWTTMQPNTKFTCIQLNEYLREDHQIMTRDRAGAPACEGAHIYTINEAAFAQHVPYAPYCDGPRGIARVICPTDPQPARLGGAYVMEINAVSRIDANGTKITLFGKRVPGWPAIQYQETALIEAESELVGNWAAVPEAKRGINQSWVWAWDPRTIGQGSGPPIVNDGRSDGVMEPKHDTRPCMLVPRPQKEHCDLLEAYFATDSHQTPAELRIGIEGLYNPWGIAITDDGRMVITERGAHRASIYQRHLDGTYERLGDVSIPQPQGVDIDRSTGDVYVGSRADFKVYRFNLNDPARAVSFFAQATTTAKSWYISVNVNNDPETGGRFINVSTNNEAANYGNPETWLPDGTKVNPWSAGFVQHGLRGGSPAVYSMPGRSGRRVLMRGGSDIGLLIFRLQRPGDIDFNTAGYWDSAGFHRQFVEDRAKWEAEGFDLVYGPHATPSICIDVNEVRGFAPWAGRFIDVCRWGEQ
jgi:hypothetical protein